VDTERRRHLLEVELARGPGSHEPTILPCLVTEGHPVGV
jgi:hypothetical protein